MKSQPQNPDFRNNPENFHSWLYMYVVGFKDLNETPGIVGTVQDSNVNERY